MANTSSAAVDKPVMLRKPALVGLLGGLTVMTMGGFAWLMAMWWGNQTIDAHQTLRLASNQYVAGNHVIAGDLAARAELDEESEDEKVWVSQKSFLLGAGLHSQAVTKTLPRERRELLTESIPLLQRSQDLGFPDGRIAEGHRMLALAMFETERFAEAIEHLRTALDADLTLRKELLPVLAQSLAALATSQDATEALVTLDEYLSDSSLDDQKRSAAELLRVDLLLRQSRWDDLDKAVKETRQNIAPELEKQVAWALDVQDQLVLAASHSVIEQLVKGLKQVPGQPKIDGTPLGLEDQLTAEDREMLRLTDIDLNTLQRESSPLVSSQARLLSARIDLLLGQVNKGLTELTLVRQLRPFSNQGLDAGIAEIELLAYQGLGEEVLQTTRYIVREIGQSQQLNFSLQRRDDFSRRMMEALANLRRSAQYNAAAETAASLQSVVTSAEASLQRGIALREWGDATLKSGMGPGGDVSRKASATARQYFRLAGDAFAESARLKFTSKDYLPTLWDAIDVYQKGRHFKRSIDLLESYLRYEERGRQSQGLVALGRALLAEGDAAAAMKPLQTCILEHSRDPLRYDAKLLAAQASAELGQMDVAQKLLGENLSDGQLSPQSPTWRDSLFTLADLMFQDSTRSLQQIKGLPPTKFIDALAAADAQLSQTRYRLSEAVQRYPGTTKSQEASYQLAQAHLLSSQIPALELELGELTESTRRELNQRLTKSQQAALDEFTKLAGELDDQQSDSDLSDKQTALLRNSLLGAADTLANMQRWGEAAEAYRDMALRTMNEPACLEALLGQSLMVRKLGRANEADLILRQAGLVLGRIPDKFDADFGTMTRYDRADWQRYLAWINRSDPESDPNATTLANDADPAAAPQP